MELWIYKHRRYRVIKNSNSRFTKTVRGWDRFASALGNHSTGRFYTTSRLIHSRYRPSQDCSETSSSVFEPPLTVHYRTSPQHWIYRTWHLRLEFLKNSLENSFIRTNIYCFTKINQVYLIKAPSESFFTQASVVFKHSSFGTKFSGHNRVMKGENPDVSR